MQLLQRPYQCQLMVQLPATESSFPHVKQLLEDTDYQKALEYVAGRKDMSRYRSIVDFLFAELVGGYWKRSCFRFYEDKGPVLADHPAVTPQLLARWDYQLCVALDVAIQEMEEERSCSWVGFRSVWMDRLAA